MEKEKIMRKFSIFVVVLMFFLPVSFALSIDKITIDASNRYAVINWQTDQVSSSTVNYGTTQKLTSSASNPVLTKNHTVLISPLKNSTKYIFNVSSANSNGTAVKGPSNFTTQFKDTKVPFINVNLPDYYGSTTINVAGTTEPNTQVYVYVNGLLSGSGFQVTGSNGIISLSGILLKAGAGKVSPNAVKIVAIDPSGNKNEVTKTVNVDKSPPSITFDSPIPNAWGEKSITIKGNSDEPAQMSVYLDGQLLNNVDIHSPWTTTVNFAQDKKYALRFYAVDKAGNVFDQTYVIVVDTVPMPALQSNLVDLTPSYVLQRTVRGKTKPGADVVVLVNNQTTSEALTFLKGLKSIASIGIPGLSAGSNQFAETLSANKLNYHTTADENGVFSVNIELTTQYRLTDEQAQLLQFQTGDSWKNEVQVVATDVVGRTNSVTQKIYYTRCGAGGFFTISSPTASPSSIPEPVLKQGYGQFSLSMDLNWNGPTDRKNVEFTVKPLITKQPGLARVDLNGRYNLTVGPNGVFKQATAFPDRPLNTEDNQVYAIVTLNPTTHDFSGAATPRDQLFTELEFPLMLELQYTYEKPGGGRSELITQRKCINTNIQVEPAITLQGRTASAFLLNASHFLDNQVKNIDKVLGVVRPAQQYTMYACGVGIVTQFLKTTWTKGECLFSGVEGGDIRPYINSGACSIDYQNGEPSCNCGTNNKLQACCDSTLSALSWQKNTVDLLCDRIFCPSVPSLDKHLNSYSDLITLPSKRGGTQSTSSLSGTSSGGPAFSRCTLPFPGLATPPSPCESEFQRAWGTAVLFDFPYKNEYDLAYRLAQPTRTTQSIGLVQDFFRGESFINNICASQPKNTATVIETGRVINGQKEAFKIYTTIVPSEPQQTLPGSNPSPTQEVTTHVDYGYYITSTVQEIQQKEQTGEVTQAKVISESSYFDTQIADLHYDTNYYCSDVTCAKAVTSLGNPSDFKKVRLPAPVISKLGSAYSKDYVYNPTGGIVSATKAMCLPAINGYLTSYKTLLSSVSACFKSIALTGKGNSGACQALLSNVVCDMVIDAVSCATHIFGNWADNSPGIFGTGANIIANPFKAVSLAGESISETITNRYGETSGFKTLFDENALMHNLCVGAFTGDFNLEGVSDLLTKATNVPVKSTCVAFPASRRFISSNPLNQGKATYLYYAGGMLAAGADITSLSLQLVCSNDNSCNSYSSSSNPRGECDCFGKPNEQTLQVGSDKFSLRQGDVFDDAKYIPIQDGDIRYDKVRLTYGYKDNMGKDVTDKCEARLSDDGQAPASCIYTPLIGFRCSVSLGDTGSARIIEGPRALSDGTQDHVYVTGDTLNLYSRMEVSSPNRDNPIRKYVKFTLKNDHDLQIYSDNFILDEGAREYNFPGASYTVKQSDFSSVGTQDTTDKRQYNLGTFDVADGSVNAATTINTNFVVTFPTKTTYECHELGTNNVIKAQNIAPSSGNTISNINCDKISFRTTGDLLKSGTSITKDIKLDDYVSTNPALVINFVKGSATTSSSCDETVRTWSGVATLYNSEQGINGIQISNNKVYTDGKYQEVPFSFKVACKRPGTQIGTTQAHPDKVTKFDIANKNLLQTDDLTIDYEAQSDSFSSINLIIDGETQKPQTVSLVNFKIAAGTQYRADMGNLVERRNIPIGSLGLSSGTHTVALSVNALVSAAQTINIK